MQKLLELLKHENMQIRPSFTGKIERLGNEWFVGSVFNVNGKTVHTAKFGNWKTKQTATEWRSELELSPEDTLQLETQMQTLREIAEEEREKVYEQVALDTTQLRDTKWDSHCELPYFEKKGLKDAYTSHDFWLYLDRADNSTVALFQDIDGKVWTHQKISPDGKKSLAKGGKKRGCFVLMGAALDDCTDAYLCEGVSTGASIFMAVRGPGVSVLCVGDCHSMPVVGAGLRAKYTDLKITVCGDDDLYTTDVNGKPWNPGREAAESTAADIGAALCFPRFA